jgi:MFS family permease
VTALPLGRLPLRRLAAIVALSFGLTFVTSTLEPALIGNKIIALITDPGARVTAFGAVTFSGLLVAMIAQPVIGALSDRARTRLGRRVPFMLAGAITVCLGLAIVALAGSVVTLVMGVLTTQLGVNLALAAWQPAIAERVPQAQRGVATGIKAGFDLLAALIGRLVAGELVGLSAQWGATALLLAIGAPIVCVLVTLPISARAIGTTGPVHDAPREPIGVTLRHAFTVDVRARPAFAWWFVNRMLFWAGVIASSVFLLFVAVDVFGYSEAEAQRYISRVAVALGGALALVILPAGWLADRLGRRPMIVLSGALAACGAAVIVLDRNQIFPSAILIGLGTGIYLSSSLALINDIVPKAEAARYLGVANIATASGSAIARLGGGTLIAGVNVATGTSDAGYIALYGAAAVAFAASAVVMAVMPKIE